MSKHNHRKVQPRTLSSKPVSSSHLGTTLVDIIILVRGRLDVLEKCLTAIPEAFPEIAYNIIIVDNASEEVVGADAIHAFAQQHKDVTWVRSKTNLGFPAGCNLGARRKASPILFFLNSDVILDPGSGTRLLMVMDKPEVVIAGMKLRFASESAYIDAGLNPSIRPA